VYYYGAAAHGSGGRRLADVRRALGYFKPDVSSAGAALWAGELGVASLSHFPPDEGPCQVWGFERSHAVTAWSHYGHTDGCRSLTLPAG
jgi:hypothetical protein